MEKATELWQREAIKLGGESLVQVIIDIKDGQDTIVDRLDKMEEHKTNIEEAINEMRSAFPAVDYEGHRRYHQTMIETLAEKRRLRIAIQEKTISGLIWIGIVGIGSAVWRTIAAALKN